MLPMLHNTAYGHHHTEPYRYCSTSHFNGGYPPDYHSTQGSYTGGYGSQSVFSTQGAYPCASMVAAAVPPSSYNDSIIDPNAQSCPSTMDCDYYYSPVSPQPYNFYAGELLPTGYCQEFSHEAFGSSLVGNSKLRKGKDEKICGVCGDRALSYNFDAISCESCKAFFRRNAPKGLEYFKCPYDERCRMDVSNRRFCKRCRLNKCFEIGMRKEYILTEEEKAQKRQKIEANRMLRQMERVAPGCSHSSTSGLNEVSSQTAVLRVEDSLAIDELLIAYRTSVEMPCLEKDLSRDRANMSDLVNIAELSMRRVIAMTKLMSSFRALQQEDKIQLLKAGSIELLILRSVITFDKDKQHFLDPYDQEETKAMKLEQLERAENGTGLFEDHMRFVKSLAMDLRADETTLILLLVVALFSPDRENIISRQYVAAQQERYCELLKRYLDSRYSLHTSRSMFPRLVMKLTEIRSLNEDHSHVLLKLNPQGIQPLMKEVLDLSP